MDLIVGRLKESDRKTCFQIIAKKTRDWKDSDKMKGFLRPKTLFNKTNFAQYQGELGRKE